jgi:hypothetical protein
MRDPSRTSGDCNVDDLVHGPGSFDTPLKRQIHDEKSGAAMVFTNTPHGP